MGLGAANQSTSFQCNKPTLPSLKFVYNIDFWLVLIKSPFKLQHRCSVVSSCQHCLVWAQVLQMHLTRLQT